MVKKINQLRAGTYLSYISLGISTLIPVFYTPIMLSFLGREEYGLYSLASSTIGYLSLLTFGFGSTIVRYLAKYRAENNIEQEEKTYGLFLIVYLILSVVALVSGILISYNVEHFFDKGLTPAETDKMSILVLIMSVNMALSFPGSVFSAVISAHEKFVFQKITGLITTVSAPILNLVALYMGYASVGMAIITTIIQIVILPVNYGYCSHILNLRPRFTKMPAALIKEMWGISFYSFVGSIVDLLFWTTDKVLLGVYTSSVAVAVYNVGATFNNMVIQLSIAISGVLAPRITAMVAKNTSTGELSEIFIRVGRLQFLVIGLVVSGFAVFGQAFILLWVGPSYRDAYWIAILTLFPLCIPLIQNTGLSILIAHNKHKFRSLVYLLIAVANVLGTIFMIPVLGGIGAALCSCISYLLGQGLIMNWYYYRKMGLDMPRFWKIIIRMAVIPAIMLMIGLTVVTFFAPDNWLIFFMEVGVFSATYCLLEFFFVMNPYEKEIIFDPFRRVNIKIKGKGAV